MQYANIIVDHKAGFEPFTYEIPADVLAHLAIGSVVLVPLGRGEVHGVVSDFVRRVEPSVATKLKAISKVIYPGAFVPTYLLKAVEDLHERYSYSQSALLFSLLPEFLKRRQAAVQSNLQPGKGFKVIEYILPVLKRVDAFVALADHLQQHGQSLLIIMPTNSAALALDRELASKGKSTLRYPTDPTPKERRQFYLTVSQLSKPTIVIGPRGALVAPLQHVGGIVIEEPWFPGHKDERTPKLWDPILAYHLCKARGISLYVASSLPWPETKLLDSPKRYTLRHESSQFRLLPNRRLEEVITQFIAEFDHGGANLTIFLRETEQDFWWCPMCKSGASPERCLVCKERTILFPRLTKDSVSDQLRQLKIAGNITLCLSDDIFQYRSIPAALVLGFDPYLSIPDFRAPAYLLTLIHTIRSQSKVTLLATRNPDAWTQILHKDADYFSSKELDERRAYNLPPFALAVQLSAPKKESLLALKLTPEETIQAGKVRKQGEHYTMSLLLKRPASIPASWQKSNVVKIDILPNYIE